MDSINDALAAILRTVQTPGDFFAAGECALHVPLIEVEGIGPIALPLLPRVFPRESGSSPGDLMRGHGQIACPTRSC